MTTEATITFCAVVRSNPNKLCKVCLICDGDALERPMLPPKVQHAGYSIAPAFSGNMVNAWLTASLEIGSL